MQLVYLLAILALASAAPAPLLQTDCPATWTPFEQHCYFFVFGPRSHAAATTTCLHMKAILAPLENEQDNGYMAANTQGVPAVWMGLNCTGTDAASCTWDNGKPLAGYTNFRKGHPNPAYGNCMAFVPPPQSGSKGEWISTHCEQPSYVVCRKGPKMIEIAH